MSDPLTIEEAVKIARWHRDAFAKAADPKPPPTPEDESPAQALTRRWTEQERAERRDEELVNKVNHEHPSPAIDDEFRTFAADQLRRRRRRRRRSLIP